MILLETVIVSCFPQPGGQWSHNASSIGCVEINCELLEPLRFGQRLLLLSNGAQKKLPANESVKLPFGSTVAYKCDKGYTLLVSE